jgi:hypothetical protein
MLRRVVLLRTNVSGERVAFIIRVTRFGELGTTLAATSNRSKLRRNTVEATDSSKTSVLTRPTQRNFPEYGILQVLFFTNVHKNSILSIISYYYPRNNKQYRVFDLIELTDRMLEPTSSVSALVKRHETERLKSGHTLQSPGG